MRYRTLWAPKRSLADYYSRIYDRFIAIIKRWAGVEAIKPFSIARTPRNCHINLFAVKTWYIFISDRWRDWKVVSQDFPTKAIDSHEKFLSWREWFAKNNCLTSLISSLISFLVVVNNSAHISVIKNPDCVDALIKPAMRIRHEMSNTISSSFVLRLANKLNQEIYHRKWIKDYSISIWTRVTETLFPRSLNHSATLNNREPFKLPQSTRLRCQIIHASNAQNDIERIPKMSLG